MSLEQLPPRGARVQASITLLHNQSQGRTGGCSEARLAGASGLGLASDDRLLRLRASLVPAPPAAGGALTDGSSGSGALSLSHPGQRVSVAKTTMRCLGGLAFAGGLVLARTDAGP